MIFIDDTTYVMALSAIGLPRDFFTLSFPLLWTLFTFTLFTIAVITVTATFTAAAAAAAPPPLPPPLQAASYATSCRPGHVEMIQHNKIVILLYTNISCFIKLIYA